MRRSINFVFFMILSLSFICGISNSIEIKKVILSTNSPKQSFDVSVNSIVRDLSPEGKEDPVLANMPRTLGFPDKIANYPLINDEDIAFMDNLYRKGQAKEAHSIFITAVDNYQDLVKYGIDLLNNKNKKLSDAKVHNILPYIISGSYRMAIVTNKSIKGNMLNLYDQLEMYKKANDQLNMTIALIADSKFEKKIKLSKSTYGLLYYARGYNKIALARTLLLGNVWKKYTVYMPADIVSLVSSAISDLNVMLDFCSLSKDALLISNGLPLGSKGEWDPLLETFLSKYLMFIGSVACEYKTIQLSYYTGDRIYIKDVIKKRVINSIYPVMDYYNSKEVQKILFTSRDITSIDDVTAIPPELFNVIIRIFDLIQKA